MIPRISVFVIGTIVLTILTVFQFTHSFIK